MTNQMENNWPISSEMSAFHLKQQVKSTVCPVCYHQLHRSSSLKCDDELLIRSTELIKVGLQHHFSVF